MSVSLFRPALAVALGLTLVAAGTSVAAPKAKPKVACNLLVDDKGDGTGFVRTDMNYLPNDPNLDIVSADIATNAKTVTAVIRTDQLTATDSSSPTGRAYYANFFVGEAQLFLSAALDGAGNASYTGGFIETRRRSLGEATGVIDLKKKEIRISAPLSLFAEKASMKPGTKITELNALAQRFIGARGVAGVTPSADAAEGGLTYTAGSPSCVAVGK